MIIHPGKLPALLRVCGVLVDLAGSADTDTDRVLKVDACVDDGSLHRRRDRVSDAIRVPTVGSGASIRAQPRFRWSTIATWIFVPPQVHSGSQHGVPFAVRY